MNLLDPVYFLLILLAPLVYWMLPRMYRLAFLNMVSMAALAWFSPLSGLMLVLVTTFTYGLQTRARQSKGVALSGLGGLILLFAGYKSLPLVHALLPVDHGSPMFYLQWVGFAFYSLKAMHVLLERYKGTLNKVAPAEFFAYMLFLPTLLIGPIHRFQAFQTDWLQQSPSAKNLSLAIERGVWGYAKIVLLGSYMVNVKLDWYIVSLPADMPRAIEYLRNLRYGLHLYFTFAGSSDVAIAFAALLGFRINENFNYPFFSTSIADFWRKWHISLSDWAKHHVYGTLVTVTRHHLMALLLTMMIIGLWHEFSARYLIWGAYHGLGLVLYYRWSSLMAGRSWFDAFRAGRFYRAAAMFVTFNFVMMGFGITRAENAGQIIHNFQRLIFGGV